jgi:transglutaminase-like putative cysteine protease
MRRLQIRHLTTYEYDAEVEFLPHRLLLRPREGHDLRIAASKLEITPAHQVKWPRDINNNCVAVVDFQEPASRLSLLSEVVVEHYDENPLDFVLEPNAVEFPFYYDVTEGIDLVPYQTPVFPHDIDPVREWVSRFWRCGQRSETYSLLDTINKAIAGEIEYRSREAPGVQAPSVTLAQGSGSCRDMAALLIEACRRIGLGARFVSGYLHAPASALGYGATHAWGEIYLPGAGWKGFDPSSGEMVGTHHIAVAVSRHPEAVPPVAGAFLGVTAHTPLMHVEVEVKDAS